MANKKIFSFPKDKFPDSLLISFEGIEGCGKSTQISLLTNFLKEQHFKVHYFREPGGTKFGEHLREAILGSDNPIAPLAEAHLFASSRAQLLIEKIIPLLEDEGNIVILDRYIDSSMAYQGHARGLGIQTIKEIHAHYPLNIGCEATFYLRIDLETSMERQNARGNQKDYFEKETNDFYAKLIAGYDLCAENDNNRIQTINAKRSIKEIHEEISAKIMDLIG